MGNCSASHPSDNLPLKRIKTVEVKEYVQYISFINKYCYIIGSEKSLIIYKDAKENYIYEFDYFITSLFFEPPNYVIVGLSNGESYLMNSRRVERTFKKHDNSIKCMILLPLKKYKLLTASLDGNLRKWDLKTGKCEMILSGHKNWILCINYILYNNEIFVISGSSDNTLILWDINNGDSLWTFTGHENSVTCVSIIPPNKMKGKILAISGSMDKTLKMWNLSTGECEATMYGHEDIINCLELIIYNENIYAISGSSDHTFRIWNLRTCKCEKVQKFNNSIIKISLLPDNPKQFVLLFDNKVMEIWE